MHAHTADCPGVQIGAKPFSGAFPTSAEQAWVTTANVATRSEVQPLFIFAPTAPTERISSGLRRTVSVSLLERKNVAHARHSGAPKPSNERAAYHSNIWRTS